MNQLCERPALRQPKRQLKLGRILVTQAAMDLARTTNVAIFDLLVRHVRGDWGDVSPSEREQNDLSAKVGLRVLSCYSLDLAHPDVKVWIVTEWNRSTTTVLLPDEY